MATYWCANFDGNVSVLRYGIAERLWLMQYQYSHNGHAFQGTPEQIASTSKNWNAAGEVKPGDWLVAYLPSNRFYAVGQVIKPRHRERHRGGARHRDTIARTIREHQHLFLNGVVHYTEASAFYEDFTDNWRRSTINYYSKEKENWLYPQRIDVKEWLCLVEDGIQHGGLAKVAPFPQYKYAIFKIPKSFFDQIRARLR